MGYAKNKKAEQGRSASVRKAPAGAGFGGRPPGRSLPSYAECPGLLGVIDAIVRSGDAILFAATSDGGALVIQLLDGAEKPKAYIVDDEQLWDNVSWLADRYGLSQDEAVPSDVIVVHATPPPPSEKGS